MGGALHLTPKHLIIGVTEDMITGTSPDVVFSFLSAAIHSGNGIIFAVIDFTGPCRDKISLTYQRAFHIFSARRDDLVPDECERSQTETDSGDE